MNTAIFSRTLPTRALSLVVATLLAAFAVPSQAQFGSSLTGTVTDASGGAIPKASATLTNEATHQTVTQTASDVGVYQFPSLAGGRYDLTVTANGYKVGTFTAIDVPEGAPRNFDVNLAPGGSSETVTVDAAETVALQTAERM